MLVMALHGQNNSIRIHPITTIYVTTYKQRFNKLVLFLEKGGGNDNYFKNNPINTEFSLEGIKQSNA